MFYLEDRTRSAELVKRVLALMEQQEASFTPASFSIWYEHLAGINPPLSRALNESLEAQQPITEERVRALYARHVLGRDYNTLDQAQIDLRHLTERLILEAQRTANMSSELDPALERLRWGLKSPETHDIARYKLKAIREDVHALAGELISHTHVLRELHTEATHLRARLAPSISATCRDALTGLPNRQAFDRAIDRLRQRPQDTAPAGLLVVDVDHLQALNNTHGSPAGDRALKAVGVTLTMEAGPAHFCGRIGEDEFAVILEKTSLADTEGLAQRFRTFINQLLIRSQAGAAALSVSIGGTIEDLHDTPEDFIHRALHFLGEAKREGPNHVRVGALAHYGTS